MSIKNSLITRNSQLNSEYFFEKCFRLTHLIFGGALDLCTLCPTLIQRKIPNYVFFSTPSFNSKPNHMHKKISLHSFHMNSTFFCRMLFSCQARVFLADTSENIFFLILTNLFQFRTLLAQ